nr:MAG: ORF1 [TTV-like mini virus]UGV42211.1 MAG: ORF1 [TTV-like mini virus]
MPPYRRTYFRRYNQRRRRNRFYRWRFRKPFQRRRTRTRRYRRRLKVKRRRPYKKKVKIVKEFQPTSINRCKVVGYKCLFQGSTSRLSTNYIQYIYATVPPFWPGGGGWSIMVFTLTSLFEDFEHLQNIWTKTNLGLPLVKYKGCKLKLYQSYDTDYIAVYDRCWPMVDTNLTHLDAAPSRMFQKKHKIVVPSRQTVKRKRPYKTVFIKPPAQMQTHWYFQKDICKLPLFMLTVTATDLLFPFCSPKCTSNNINIPCISPYIFKNLNFTHYGTSGYSPKNSDRNEPMFLYASTMPNLSQLKKSEIQTLIPLKNTKNFQAGQKISSTYTDTPQDWGNPFYHHYITGLSQEDNFTIYISTSTVSTMKTALSQSQEPTNIFVTKLTGPMVYLCRYNPEKDKGDTNKMYLVSTNTNKTEITPPDDTNLIIDGFPLFILTWSWTDWVKKAKIAPDIDKYRVLVFNTKTLDPELPAYIPIDYDFLNGYDPYTPNQDNQQVPHTPNQYNSQNWHPKLLFQQQTVEHIAQTGPFVHRQTTGKYVQAYAKYKFYFEWGGCPKQLPKPYEPCLQPKWTTADNISTRLEITNPSNPPQSELYSWDWEEDYVKKAAIQRISYYTETDKTNLFSTGNKNNPLPLKKVQEKDQTSQEEEKTIFNKLLQLRQQRLLLEQQLQQQLK